MGKSKNSEATATSEPAPASATNASATGAPLPIETLKIQDPIEVTKIDLPAIDLPKLETPKVEPVKAAVNDTAAPVAPAPAPWTPSHRSALLAASVALAAVLGAVAGAAVTAAFTETPPPPTGTAIIADETRSLKENVARLGSELATLKAGIDAAHRNTNAQLGKLAERFDRAEKAQSEPAGKLAKIVESLDRLERRPAVAAASDVTGAVTIVEKQQAKPPLVEGWRLRDFYAGRAVVESRGGGIYEVGPGSNLPGLGKVEAVKREDGRIIVVTPKGIIASAMEPPRRPPPYYGPYRY